MKLQEYHRRCQERIKERDSIIKGFVASQEKFVTCPSCLSSIASESANQWYTWHTAKCLVCRSSLLPEDKQQSLKKILQEADKDYSSLSSEDKLGHGSPSVKSGWAPIRELVVSGKKKKGKWWWPFGGRDGSKA